MIFCKVYQRRNRITNFSLILKKIGISTLNFQIILQKSHGELFDCPINMGKLSTYDFGKSHGEWFDCPINMGKLSTYDSFKIIRGLMEIRWLNVYVTISLYTTENQTCKKLWDSLFE